MKKLFRTVGVLLMIALLVLAPAACRTWESGMHLIVTLSTPEEGATVTASPIVVGGTLSKHATVTINDVPLDGKVTNFSTNVPLTVGTNVIRVVATSNSPDETVTKTVTVTYVPAK